MPVPPKPAERRQRRNPRDLGTVVSVPQTARPAPAMPAGLLAPVRAAGLVGGVLGL